MVNKQSTQKGFVILGAAGIISKIMSVAYVPLLTLILLNEGNGIYNAGYSVYAFIYVLANQGAPVAISKCISEQVALGHFADSRKTFKLALMFMGAIGLLMSLILLIFAGPFSDLISFRSAELTIVAFAPTILFSALASAYRGYFQGRSNMTPTGVSQILEQFVNCVASIIGAVIMKNYGAGVAASMGLTGVEASSMALMYAAMGATFGTTLGALVSWCYLAAVFDRNKSAFDSEAEANGDKPIISPSDALKKVLKYIVPISMGAVLIVIANTVDLVNVKTRLLAAGFTDQVADSLYGILSTQWQKIINIPLVLVTAMGVAVFPQISEAVARNDRKKMASKIRYAFNVLYSITIPAAIGLFVLAEPILIALFPTTVEPISITMMQVGAICVVLIGIVNMQTSVLQSVGKVYTAPIIMFFALIVKIILNYVLVADPAINVMGAVIGTIVCYALAAAVNHYFVRKHTVKIRGIEKTIARTLLASAIMGSMAYLVYRLCVVILGTSYICTLLSLGISFVVAVVVYFLTVGILNGRIGGRRSAMYGDEPHFAHQTRSRSYDMTVEEADNDSEYTHEPVECSEAASIITDTSAETLFDGVEDAETAESIEVSEDAERFEDTEISDAEPVDGDVSEAVDETITDIDSTVYKNYIEEIGEDDYL